MRKLLKQWNKISVVRKAFWICAVAQLMDVVSSIGAVANGFYETNPLTRWPNGDFYLLHGVMLKLYWLGVYGVMAWAIWEVTSPLPMRYRQVLTALPLLYLAWIGFDAATGNALLHLHWLQAVPQEQSGFMIG